MLPMVTALEAGDLDSSKVEIIGVEFYTRTALARIQGNAERCFWRPCTYLKKAIADTHNIVDSELQKKRLRSQTVRYFTL